MKFFHVAKNEMNNLSIFNTLTNAFFSAAGFCLAALLSAGLAILGIWDKRTTPPNDTIFLVYVVLEVFFLLLMVLFIWLAFYLKGSSKSSVQVIEDESEPR